jgi:hypothetical protein
VGAKVELTGDVHYPTGLPDGPYPLVLFMHGNHVSCYRGNETRYRWPCGTNWKPLPKYAGYDYIARRLASHGYVVVSVSANPAYQANLAVRRQDLSVVLIDGSGASAEVLASQVGNAALAYPLGGRRRRSGHVILNQVRFALDVFDGVDLDDVAKVELRFSRTQAGVLDLADVAFSRGRG